MNWKLPAGILALVLIIAVGAWWIMGHPRAPKIPETPEQIIREAKNEPIPANAREIDAFAYADENDVYLKSAFSTSTTKVPGADPDTFKNVVSLKEYTNQEIADFCKGPGTYSIYTDRKKTYFFQFWKTPTFAATKIEVVKDLDPDTFSVSGDHLFTDGVNTMTIGYQFSTTTCELTLKPA